MQLAGGTASMQQLKERLEKDLLEVYFFPEALLTVFFYFFFFVFFSFFILYIFFYLLLLVGALFSMII
jgi:hypothetical protein